MGYTFLDESFIELWKQLSSLQCFMPTPSLPQYNMKEEEKSLTPEEEKTASSSKKLYDWLWLWIHGSGIKAGPWIYFWILSVGGFNLLADVGRKLTVDPVTIISQQRSDVNKQISSAPSLDVKT
jgi:hypothetical protein